MRDFAVVGVNWWAIAPEAICALGAAGALLVSVFFGRRGGYISIAVGVLALTGAAAAALFDPDVAERTAFDGTVAFDRFAVLAKLVIAAAALLSLSAAFQLGKRHRDGFGDLVGLILFAAAGMMLMTAAADLIVMFIALETFSLALYVLVAFRRDRDESQEGALKYFLMGSFAGAFFLFGVALTFGSTGSTRLWIIADRIAGGSPDALLLAGVALLIVGLAFKVAAVPFHMWTPDAYQGAAAPVAGFMAAGSKVAAFAALLRVLVSTFDPEVIDWRPTAAGIAAVTMVFGSIAAIAQTNIKRMLAYSSIAHTGFLFTGVVASNDRGVSGSLFYFAAYSLAIIGCFAVVYAARGRGDSIEDFRGLGRRQPMLAGLLALLLISLSGVPPTAGFWAKFEVFSAAYSGGYGSLIVVGVAASAIAAFFYLRVIALMFLEPSDGWADSTDVPAAPLSSGFPALVCGVAVLALGVFPAPLLSLAGGALL